MRTSELLGLVGGRGLVVFFFLVKMAEKDRWSLKKYIPKKQVAQQVNFQR